MKGLITLGYDDWFQKQIDTEILLSHELARVVSVHKESYMISKGSNEVFAELAGKLSYSSDSVIDLPTTGDWVYVDFYDDDSHAVIHDVVPRKTVLKRKASGKSIDFQLIAANIDFALIVQSVDYNFNLRRLERYLVMINDSNITPIILLSKSDLLSKDEINKVLDSVIIISPQTKILTFSNESGDNLDSIKNLLVQGKTYCLLGSSGVGKTSLLNNLIGKALFETKTVSKIDSKGRHTTTSRELIQLDGGAILIDTPGMRELGNLSVGKGIDETFSDVVDLSLQCKFNNCSHTTEKGCAILSAISDGQLSDSRYNNYLKMKKESSLNEMSYLDKKQKDKNLGKLIKSVKKRKGHDV